MRGTILHAPDDVRYEERPDPRIIEPTDAVVRMVATCICGSDLWPYRGIDAVTQPWAIGHEYCGIVEEVGSAITSVRLGQFVIGGFVASDNSCPHCRAGVQTRCQQGTGYDGCQSELIRIPLADGTLVATPVLPPEDLILLASSSEVRTLQAGQRLPSPRDPQHARGAGCGRHLRDQRRRQRARPWQPAQLCGPRRGARTGSSSRSTGARRRARAPATPLDRPWAATVDESHGVARATATADGTGRRPGPRR